MKYNTIILLIISFSISSSSKAEDINRTIEGIKNHNSKFNSISCDIRILEKLSKETLQAQKEAFTKLSPNTNKLFLNEEKEILFTYSYKNGKIRYKQFGQPTTTISENGKAQDIDGKVEHADSSVQINRDIDSIYSPRLQTLFISSNYFSDILEKNNFAIKSTETKPNIGKIVTLKGNIANTYAEFTFAIEKDYVCIEKYFSKSEYSQKYQVLSIIDFNGTFMPNKIETKLTLNNRIISETFIEYKNLSNLIDDSSFIVNLKTGGRLYDQENNQIYRIGSHGEKIPVNDSLEQKKKKNILGIIFITSISTLILLGFSKIFQWNYRKKL